MAETSDHNNTEVAEGLTYRFEVESPAFTPVQTSSFMSISTKLHVFKKKKKKKNMDKMGELGLTINDALLLQYCVYCLYIVFTHLVL